MTKPALAAVVALALSIPLANLTAGAQGSSAETKSESKSTVPTTFSAPQQANRSQTVQTGTAPPGWVTTHGTSGTRQTTASTSTTSTTTSTTATTATTSTASTAASKTDDTVTVTSSTPRV